jgi:hypothetical protein
MSTESGARIKRRPTICCIAVAALCVMIFPAPASAGADRICVAGYDAGKLTCLEEPRKLSVGDLGVLRSIHWNFWSPARRVIGFGRLRVSGGCCEDGVRSRGRVKLTKLKVCGKSLWWTRLTIKYGRGYNESYVRNATLASPCT